MAWWSELLTTNIMPACDSNRLTTFKLEIFILASGLLFMDSWLNVVNYNCYRFVTDENKEALC